MKKDVTSIHIVYLTNFSNLSSKKDKVKKKKTIAINTLYYKERTIARKIIKNTSKKLKKYQCKLQRQDI